LKTAALLLMAGSIFFGSVQGARLKKDRICLLRELVTALELLEGELALRNTALPELLEELAELSKGDAERMFRACLEGLHFLQDENFSHLWKNAAEEYCAALEQRELTVLVRLGTSLGRYDLDTQLRDIRNTEHLLRNNLEEAEHAYPAQRKLWLGLGASAAALLGVILL
jgi:stage III sporulation protein AB